MAGFMMLWEISPTHAALLIVEVLAVSVVTSLFVWSAMLVKGIHENDKEEEA